MEQPEKYFEGLSKEEILEQLEANSDEIEEREFIKPFTDEEQQAEDLILSDHTKKVFDLNDDLIRVSKPLKDEIKFEKEREKAQRDMIKAGGYPVQGKIYMIHNHDKKQVLGYSEDGTLIDVRPMTSKERQLSLKYLNVSR